jgi:hypothetical protein
VFIILTFCIIVFVLVVITIVIFVVVVVAAALVDICDLLVVMTCTPAGRLTPELTSLAVLNNVFATILPVRMAMMQA